MPRLHLDEALLIIQNELNDTLNVYSQLNECYQCPLAFRGEVPPNSNLSVVINTKWSSQLKVETSTNELCYENNLQLLDQGQYNYHVCLRGCELTTVEEGLPLWLPIVIAFVIILMTILFSKYGVKFIAKKLQRRPSIEVTSETDQLANANSDGAGDLELARTISAENATCIEQQARKTKREKSLDVLRGLIITSMIFVNYGGGGFAFFHHAPWYGMTFADIIFPAFIFMMGVSIALSVKSQLARAGNRFQTVLKHICIRTIKLFAIGLILNTHNTDLTKLRIPGVLQRFAASYFAVAMIHLFSVYRANQFLTSREAFPSAQQMLIIFAPEVTIYVAIMALYLGCTFALQFEDCPAGYQGPGGLDQNAKYFNCTGGAAGYIDRVVFGSEHIYQHPTSLEIYEHTLPYDPEGLLGTTTSILLTALGLISGRILLRHRNPSARAVRLFLVAVTCGAFAFALAATGLIPVSKNLWSLSFVLATGSLSISMLLILYLIIDIAKLWPDGFPFMAPGKNSIFLYIGHEIGTPYFPFYYYVNPASHALLLMRVCIASGIWIAVALYLDKIGFYLTL